MSNNQPPISSLSNDASTKQQIAVVIPCYREKDQILEVLTKIDSAISHIIVVDDGCPDKTGEFVHNNYNDSR